MNRINFKPLRVLGFISLAVAFLLWVCFIVFSTHEWLRMSWENLVTQLNVFSNILITFFSLIILVKTGSQKGILLFGLFLSLFSQNIALSYIAVSNNSWVMFVVATLNKALTATVFLKATQNFPRELTSQDIDSVFKKRKTFKGFVKWAIKDLTWLLFFSIILVCTTLSAFSVVNVPINFMVLVTGFLCFFVNYKRSSASGMNKILWLFWGVLANVFIVFIAQILIYYNGGESQTFHDMVILLQTLVIVLSLIMSLFFFDTFNTGAIVSRTIADSCMFILIVIVYNTTEHYFLHWLSHELHLSDVLISSLLSGVFVMLFSPVHHKLMHFVEKKVKHHPVQHA